MSSWITWACSVLPSLQSRLLFKPMFVLPHLAKMFNISKAGGFWLLYQTRDSENRGHTFWSCSFRQCLAFRIELMAAHSSTLVWELQWTEQPGELQSMVFVARSQTQLHFHFSLPRIGEGNGNPLQYSCLENPRDGGAWWAAVYGVAESWTRLKWLSSSSRLESQGGVCLQLSPERCTKPW